MSVVPATHQAPVPGPALPRAMTLPAVAAPDRAMHAASRRPAIAAANRHCIVAAWADDVRVLRYLLG